MWEMISSSRRRAAGGLAWRLSFWGRGHHVVDMRLGLERHRVDKVGNLEPKPQEGSSEGLRCAGVKGWKQPPEGSTSFGR